MEKTARSISTERTSISRNNFRSPNPPRFFPRRVFFARRDKLLFRGGSPPNNNLYRFLHEFYVAVVVDFTVGR